MKEHLELITSGAEKKYQFFKYHPLAYLVSAMWAGAAVGIGMILIASIGMYGERYGFAMTKAVMGFSFSMALSIVVVWGLELFTGSNLFMTAGALCGKLKWRNAVSVWGFTFLGNFLGAALLSLLYAGVDPGDSAAEYLVNMALMKTSPDVAALFLRGVLCNVLVCLAVLICYKMESESGKLIMIFWCIYTFVVLGFEHSVANMTLFSMTSVTGHADVITPSLILHNMVPVTLGNIVGGGFVVGGSMYVMGKK